MESGRRGMADGGHPLDGMEETNKRADRTAGRQNDTHVTICSYGDIV